jgi:hypothetical protein
VSETIIGAEAMTDDLIQRLEQMAEDSIGKEAAAEIRRLRAERNDLKASGWEDCETCHGIVDGKRHDAAVKIERLQEELAALKAQPAQGNSLENCRLFAARHRKEEWAKTILRFCAEGGAVGSPLRDAQPSAAIDAAMKGQP